MAHVLLVVAGIALVDSLNPTTIGPALVLAAAAPGRAGRKRVRDFTIGVFAVFLAGGVLLVLGPGQLLLAALPHPGRTTKHVVQLILGALLLIAATVLWLKRERLARKALPTPDGSRGALALGAAIAAAELPTALPYFAAIAAIVDSDAGLPVQLGLLLVFNVLFVAPLLAMMIAMVVAGERAEPLLKRTRERFERHWPALTASLFAAAGVVLIFFGAIGLHRPHH